jgi:hypothetical protein
VTEQSELAAWFRVGYTLVAALAGAVTALSLMPSWQEMKRSEIIMTLTVGFSFAVFVTPWASSLAFGQDVSPYTQACMTYIMGSGANSILPTVIRKVRGFFGTGEEK